MVGTADYLNAADWLKPYKRPLVMSHHRPDGDALGAIAGMALALVEAGKHPLPVVFEPLPNRYSLLADVVDWCRWAVDEERLRKDADALVLLDTCAVAQLEPIAALLDDPPPTLIIDHHSTNDPIGERGSDLRLIDSTAGAACLLVAEWMQANELAFTEPIATALYVGLTTDTGWFRFPNTDARLLRMAATLLEAGAASQDIYRAVYQQDPPERLRLISRMLSSLELHAEKRLAVLYLRQTDFAAAGADRGMTEDLINEATRLATTEATVLFTEDPDDVVRVNFRSKRWLDVSAIARQFGGGGHARASGARPQGAWDELVPLVIAATVKALDDGPGPA